MLKAALCYIQHMYPCMEQTLKASPLQNASNNVLPAERHFTAESHASIREKHMLSVIVEIFKHGYIVQALKKGTEGMAMAHLARLSPSQQTPAAPDACTCGTAWHARTAQAR